MNTSQRSIATPDEESAMIARVNRLLRKEHTRKKREEGWRKVRSYTQWITRLLHIDLASAKSSRRSDKPNSGNVPPTQA